MLICIFVNLRLNFTIKVVLRELRETTLTPRLCNGGGFDNDEFCMHGF